MNGLCIAYLLIPGLAMIKVSIDMAWMLIAPMVMGWRR